MKQMLIPRTLIFGMLLIFISCQKEELLLHDKILNDSENIIIKKVTDSDLINKFRTRVTLLKSTESIIFDTDVIFEARLSESAPKVLIANQVGFDESNESNLGFAIAVDEYGNLGQAAIVETETVDELTKIINYYDDSNTLILSLMLDANSESIETIYRQSNFKVTGQSVLDCVTDSYTNHGWVSVWAFVQTAFIPATAAAIAGACLVANL